MYVRWMELKGTLETLDEINAAYMAETGSTETWSEDSEAMSAWIEHANGNTYILAELDGAQARECIERFGGRA